MGSSGVSLCVVMIMVLGRSVWSSNCLYGWSGRSNSNTCYFFTLNGGSAINWADARQKCITAGADLVSIKSEQELNYINQTVNKLNEENPFLRWWIGLNRQYDHSTWKWADGTRANLSNLSRQWWKDVDLSDKYENCVNLHFSNMDMGHCIYSDYQFICSRPGMVGQTAPPQTTTPSCIPAGYTYGCPHNWHGYRGSCYYFVSDTGSFDNSSLQCGYKGAKLASIIDDSENNFVFSMIPRSIALPDKTVWIGLNDRAIEMNYVWIDGEPATYTNWHKYEPNHYEQDENCVAMYTTDSLWKDKSCSKSLQGAVCEKPKTIIPSSQVDVGAGCNRGQLGYHVKCYDFRWSPTKTWSDAEKDCVSNGGHLATIPDRQVQVFLGAEMLYKASACWVGLTDNQSPGQYQWSSGQAYAFSAWYKNHTGNERNTCVGIQPGSRAGLWENHNCADHRSYICESPRQAYTTLPTLPTTSPLPTTTPMQTTTPKQNPGLTADYSTFPTC